MARVKEITCTISQTHNLGNYNSLKVEWSEVVDFRSDDPNVSDEAGEQHYLEVVAITRERVSKRVEELAMQERPTGVTANTARRSRG